MLEIPRIVQIHMSSTLASTDPRKCSISPNTWPPSNLQYRTSKHHTIVQVYTCPIGHRFKNIGLTLDLLSFWPYIVYTSHSWRRMEPETMTYTIYMNGPRISQRLNTESQLKRVSIKLLFTFSSAPLFTLPYSPVNQVCWLFLQHKIWRLTLQLLYIQLDWTDSINHASNLHTTRSRCDKQRIRDGGWTTLTFWRYNHCARRRSSRRREGKLIELCFLFN